MVLFINNKKYSFKPGYNTHKPSDNGWKKQNQDAFKICIFGGVNVFIKRFDKETHNIPGYQFLVKIKGRRLPSLPMIYDVVTVNENGKNVTYLFQEALDGNTLEEIMHQGTLKFNSLQFAKNLYDALQSITNEGFWYTDFVEKNIFVTNYGQYYLIDLDSVAPLSILPNEDNPLISQVNKNYKIAVSTYWYRDTFRYPFTFIRQNLRGDTINYLELFIFIAQIRFYIDNKCSVNFTEAKTRKAVPAYLLNLNNSKTYDLFKSCFLDSATNQNILPYFKLESYIKEVLFPNNKTYEIDFHNACIIKDREYPQPNPSPPPKPEPVSPPNPDIPPKKTNFWLWIGGLAAILIIGILVINSSGENDDDYQTDFHENVENHVVSVEGKEAIITDPDGYTNVRGGKGTDFPIIYKLITNEKFTVYPIKDNNWWKVEVGNGEIGYIYYDRVHIINNSLKGNYTIASNKVLSINDLENLSLKELKLMRNEIFARHGFIFDSNGEMNKYFSNTNWYSPRFDDVGHKLTEIEKFNIKNIKNLEAQIEHKDGIIIGSRINLREFPTISSRSLLELSKGQKVIIVDENYASNNNEASLRYRINVNYNGKKLQYNPGKAVKIKNVIGNNYKIEIYDPSIGTIYYNIHKNDLELISNTKWYNIMLQSGEKGWVLSKFVKMIN